MTNNGLTGDATRLHGRAVCLFAGGYWNLMAQIFRRNYPELLGRVLAEHSAAQPRGAGRLRDQRLDIRQNELNCRSS